MKSIFQRNRADGVQPLMTSREVAYIENVLRTFPRKRLRICEWGSGGSTLHFTRFLRKHGIEYEWISIEYNRPWYEKMNEYTADDPNVYMKLFDAGNNRLRQRSTDMEEYIAYPRTLNIRFDFVLVDGRKRRRCLLEAHRLLSDDGVVVLHDAQRHYYRCAMRTFDDGRLVSPQMWRGTTKRASFWRRCENRVASSVYAAYYWCVKEPINVVKRLLRTLKRRLRSV